MMSRNGSIPDYEYSPGVLAHRVGELEERVDSVEAEGKKSAEEHRSTATQVAVLIGQLKLAMWIVPGAFALISLGIQIAMKLFH
jgi:hypothetical protein